MSWDNIASIASVVAAFGVMGSVIYLARQVRQDAAATTASAMASWLSDYNKMVLEILRDAQVAELFQQGLTDFEQLNKNDQMRFHAWMVAHLLNAQNVFLQLNDGTIHRRIADQILPFNAAMLNSKGGLYWWSTARAIWRPEFVAYMDKLIKETPPITNVWPWFSTSTQELGVAERSGSEHAV
jgi:hypothetical protein